MGEWIRTGLAVTACHLAGLGFVSSETIRKLADAGEIESFQMAEGLNYRIRRASLADFLRRKASSSPRLPEALAMLEAPKKSA